MLLVREAKVLGLGRAGVAVLIALVFWAGCQRQRADQPRVDDRAAQPKAAFSQSAQEVPAAAKASVATVAAAGESPAGRANFVAAAHASEFDASRFEVPRIDEDAVKAAGLRKVGGEHITIYTDLPAAAEIEELPRVFDAAVLQWCDYFSVPKEKASDWKVVASVMKDKGRFVTTGLYPASLPDFANGYNVGSQIWVFDQPSGYYRRHLLLHEGTHAFMLRFLGGAGPPWYMEGMAELLATHRWQNDQLELAVMPQRKEDVPYWGRIKIIKDDVAADRGLSLMEVMKYDAKAHLKVEAYGWCWAAAWFLSHHPQTATAFADLETAARDRSLEFSKRFYENLKPDWPAIAEDWQIFTGECDYGYDVARAAVVRKPVAELPMEGATVNVSADHGWQSTGFRLSAGKKYEVKASGRYTVRASPPKLICEPGGITLHYHRGRPLGILLAGVSEIDQTTSQKTPLLSPQSIGLSGDLIPAATGTLFLKINEASSGLADNSGSLNVEIREIN
ncbi:MAG TPA: hypothetical protein VGI40_01650 [Pirellulaceae bacterium]|jgi:hypothetical protein